MTGGVRDMKTSAIRWIGAVLKKPLGPISIALAGPLTLGLASKREIWQQLCVEIGADYVQGGFWKGDKVQATHAEWTITLDTFAVSTGKVTMTVCRTR
jgi:hypothetical protein